MYTAPSSGEPLLNLNLPCFLMSGVRMLYFSKDQWKFIPIHLCYIYTMALDTTQPFVFSIKGVKSFCTWQLIGTWEGSLTYSRSPTKCRWRQSQSAVCGTFYSRYQSCVMSRIDNKLCKTPNTELHEKNTKINSFIVHNHYSEEEKKINNF